MATTISASRTRRPSWRFVATDPAHAIAFGGGAGLAPVAPGTVGTLAAIPLHLAAAAYLPTAVHLGCIALMFLLGIWASGRTAHDLGVPDHPGIVCDEIAAFLLVLFATPSGYGWLAAAFALFRFFDIVKPPPIRYVDRNVKGGVGVMLDDVLAAGYSVLCIAILQAFVGGGG